MTDATVGVFDQTGTGTKKVDVSQVTVNGQTVERQRVVLADPSAPTQLATVTAASALKVDGSATTQPVSQSSQAIGTAGMATGQVALTGDTAVLIAAARTGPLGTGRASITINNITDRTIWIAGVDTVTATNGFPLLTGESVTLQTTAALYAVLDGAGTPTVGFLELF